MHPHVKSGRALLEEIDRTISPTPALWWLGRTGFVFRFATITFYLDPNFSSQFNVLDASEIRNADLILSSSGDFDVSGVAAMLESSKHAKLVLPRSAGRQARAAGIAYERMTTTDADLRIEYFKDSMYGRVYAVPSTVESSAEGYASLGYLIRFGRWTVYHAGNCVPYAALADRLRPYNVSVALLPVGAKNFSAAEASQLAASIGASWLVPMLPGLEEENSFIAHMLGRHPEQAFKVFRPGEKWVVPED